MNGIVGGIVGGSGGGLTETTGVFTPTLQDDSQSDAEGQTYTTQIGIYRKHGDVCHFWLNMTINSLGTLTTGNAARIANLPFSAASGITHAVNVGDAASLAITAGQYVSGIILSGQRNIIPQIWSSSSGASNLTVAQFSAGGSIQISGSYVVAS